MPQKKKDSAAKTEYIMISIGIVESAFIQKAECSWDFMVGINVA